MDRRTSHIEAEIAPWLQAAGCDSFDALVAAPVGSLVGAQEKRAEVRLITATHAGMERTFFLKRSRQEEVTKLMRCLLGGMAPMVGAMREVTLLRQLRAAGFEAMQPLAWGQRRRCGWPMDGFMVCEKIEGVGADQLRLSLDPTGRCRLQQSMGHLVGRLHIAGFFQPVRLKDLICRGAAGGTSTGGSLEPFDLVLIDRATSKPWVSRFSAGRCRTLLERTNRRVRRDGQALTADEAHAFAQGYSEAVASRWTVSPDQIAKWLVGDVANDAAPTAPAQA